MTQPANARGGVPAQLKDPMVICGTSWGGCVTLACTIALVTISSMGLAGTVSMATVAGTAIGIGGTGLVLGLLGTGGKPINISVYLLFGGCFSLTLVTLGGLGFGGILTLHQLSLGVLITAVIPTAVGIPIASCCVCCIGSSALGAFGVATAS